MHHRSKLLALLTLALAAMPAVTRAQDQPLNPFPNRTNTVIYGFETEDVDGIQGGDVNGSTVPVSSNTDAQFVSQGTKSLQVDMTGLGQDSGWTDPFININYDTPKDWSGNNAFSMDVYVPADSITPNANWFQMYPRFNDSQGEIALDTRDLHAGWNFLIWDLPPGRLADVTRFRVAEGNNGAVPFSGTVYFDNFRLWKDELPGVHGDETLVSGFDTEDDIAHLQATDPITLTLNTDPQFVKTGAGSMMVDMTDVSQDWHNDFVVPNPDNPFPDFDASGATAVELDVYIPAASAPDSWSQFGYEIGGSGGGYGAEGPGAYLRDQWSTFVIALSPDQATALSALNALRLRRNSGAAWRGPVYVDNFRIVDPSLVNVAPNAPTGLTATGGNAKVTLTWPVSGGADSYNVMRGAAAGGPYTKVNTAPVTGTNYTDTTVTNGTTYYYVVTAVNTKGESGNSPEASATPAAPTTPPAAPANLKATAGLKKVDLSWDAVSGAESYNLKRSATAGGPYTNVNPAPLTTRTFSDTTVTNGTTYYYVVTAVNGAGESANSSEVSATPTKDPVLNPYPWRENKLLFGFEGGLEGWSSIPEGTELGSVNSDADFVSEGNQSFKADFTNLGTGNTLFTVTMDEPVDITGYHYLAMDIYVPKGGLGSGWYQFLPHIQTDNGNSDLGNRDLHEGWNRFTWQMSDLTDPEATTNLTGLSFGGSMDTTKPYMTPIYIDNVRVYKGDQVGVKSDEQVILNFDAQEDVDQVAAGGAVGVSLNEDEAFKQAGAGSLAVDLTDVAAYGPAYSIVTLATPFDGTKATAYLVDIFIPAESRADSWYQNGIQVNYTDAGGASHSVNTATHGFKTAQWDTLEIDVTPQQAAQMVAVTGFQFSQGGGSPWHGPIYFDNLRAVVAPVTPGGCLGNVTDDNAVDVQDAVAILRHVVNLGDPLTGQKLTNANVNGDAGVDVQDAVIVLQAIVDIAPGNTIITKLTCGG